MAAFVGILIGLIVALFLGRHMLLEIIVKMNRKNAGEEVDEGNDFMTYCAALNSSEMRNLIISGGRTADRFLAVTNILNEANNKRIPTIVLHSGFAPFSQFSQNTYYDPCIGADSDEIAEILTDAAVNALNIDSVVHASIKFIVDILRAANGEVMLSDVVKFPYDDVMGYLDEKRSDNVLSDAQYDKFKQRYNNPAIRDNIFKVAPLFAKLKTISQKPSSAQPINFQQAVAERQILFFDLLNDANAVLKELVFAAISKLTEISKFWVVAEGISFIGKDDSKVDTIFTKNRNNISLIYSGEDVPALTSQTKDTFETLVGGNSQLLLFAHASSNSATRWAEHFGEEHKETISQNEGSSRQSFSFRSTNSSGITVSAQKDFRFPPQHFMQRAQTRDASNDLVTRGLEEGECYFIKEGTIAKDEAWWADDENLLRIKLPPVPLLIGHPQHQTQTLPQAQGKTCTNCGMQIMQDSATFCTSCGTKTAAE